MEEPRHFFLRFIHLGPSDLLPKTDLEKNKSALVYRMKYPMAYSLIGTQRESCKSKNGLFPTILS